MLQSDDCELTGLDEETGSYVIQDPADGLVCVTGKTAVAAIQDAAEKSGDEGNLLCQLEDEEHVAAALPDWRSVKVELMLQADSARMPDAGDEWEGVETRFFTHVDLAAAREVSDELRQELTLALLRSEVASTIVDGKPVSFCYVGALTETLWDMAIETLEPYRGRGYAGLAAAHLIRHMYRKRKQPVWATGETNTASLRVAKKLRFRPVDRMVVFHPAG
jgi:RimJ/RimL family protein N-acetyltransferase